MATKYLRAWLLASGCCSFQLGPKIPVFKQNYSTNKDTISVQTIHKNMDMKSLDFSLPIRQFIVRCEIAEYFGEAKNVKPDMDDIG